MPEKISGSSYSDERGKLLFNNQLDLSEAKRIYVIENADCKNVRAWQAHKIESRWFVVVAGSFEIRLVRLDNFENPSADLASESYILNAGSFDALIIEPGYASSIRALEEKSKLIVFADYQLNEIEDNYKFDHEMWN